MRATEKAADLLNRVSECGEDNEMYIETAKKCALFVVEELIKETDWSETRYWEAVKQEIEKL